MPRSRSGGAAAALDIISVADLLSVERLMLGELATPRNRVLIVPPNQRPWSWREEEINEFFSDLMTTVNRTHEQDHNGRWMPRRTRERPHFFGTVVFDVEDQASDERFVVDGQQRLTALCLLASSLQIRLDELVVSRGLTGNERTEAAGLSRSLEEWLYGRDQNGEPVAKLELDPEYQPFFLALVLEARSRTDRGAALAAHGVDNRVGQKEHPVEARLAAGLIHAQQLLDGKPVASDTSAELSWVRAINATLRHAFGVVVLNTVDEQFSYSVFSWLNARGTELSEGDKIKAELFDRSPSVEHQRITDAWNAMIAAAPQRDAQAFLRHHHIAFVGVAELRKLHGTVTQLEIAPAAHPYLVAETWARRSEALQQVMTAAPGSPMPAACRRAITAIVSDLGYSLLRPLLLAAAVTYLPSDWESFTKCVRLGLNYALRMLTIGSEQEATLERKIGEVSRMLTLDSKSVADVGAELRKANPDGVFEKRFAEYGTSRTSIQFYILNEIERSLSRGGLVPADHGQTAANNIEHILPRNLSRTRTSEWPTWRDPADVTRGSDDHKLYRNRIGNLLLLESDINKEVGDYEFLAKKTGAYPGRAATVRGRARLAFKDSALQLPKRLVRDRQTTVWTSQSIEDRQAELAKIALRVWTLHPARL
jgi:hypothetical protein